MNTTYRMKENPTTRELKPVSVWQKERFQRFAAIAVGTGLLLSLVGAFNLRADVGNLTQIKVPYIQSQMDKLQVR
jgi:hypothetical protein